VSPKVLIVDEIPRWWTDRANAVERDLKCSVHTESRPTAVLGLVSALKPSVVIARKWLRDDSGARLLTELAHQHPEIVQIVVATRGEQADTLAPAMAESHAFAVVPDDVAEDNLVQVVRDALEHGRNMASARAVRSRWLARSADMMEVEPDSFVQSVQTAAPSASKDTLTGLSCAEHIRSHLEYEVERHRRYGAALSVVLADVDHLGSINDQHGFDAGDMVLQAVGRLIADTVRRADVAGRLGGEEFLVVCPHTGEDGAAILGQRLRDGAHRLRSRHKGKDLAVTLSAGVAAIGEDGPIGPDKLLALAETALTYSKERGRDRVTRGSEIELEDA